MVRVIPYLTIKNGKKAIELYKEVFNAKLMDHQPVSKEQGANFNLPENFDYDNSTMHAELEIGRSHIYLSDNMGSQIESSGQRIEILLELDTKEEIEAIYNKAKERGAEIKMELQETFWGAMYARFKDPFGIGWQLNHTLPQEETK